MKKVPFFSIISFNLYLFVKNKTENLCHIKKMIKIEIITLIIPHLIITVVVILKIGKIKKGSKKVTGVVENFWIYFSSYLVLINLNIQQNQFLQ